MPPAATHACAITTVRFMPAGGRVGADAGRRLAEHGRVAPLPRRLLTGARIRRGGRAARGLGLGRGLVRQAEGGLQVRDAVDGDRPVLVGQHDRLREPGPVGAQVDAGRVDQRAVDPEPQRRVVVAADQDHPGAGAAEPGERVLAERDRVHRRDGPVVDVARDEDRVHPLGPRGLDEVVEECRLRFSQVGPVERPPEMPVRGMQEPHGRDSSESLRHSGPELRLPAALDASRRCAMTTTAHRPPRPRARPRDEDAGHVDVLIIGAGVSGIGAAHHLREKFPDRTFVILDAQDSRGGTWWTHRYPGVRSDSDLFTYGYRFKPWRGPAIAAGGEILAYLDEVIADDDLGPHIRLRHQVTAASWSSEDRRWTVEVTRGDTGRLLRFTAGFLWMCQGYYNHAKPYRPQWEGTDRFQGAIVHPQNWPDDLDLTGKRVVVIGSGATAATLIPAIAEKAEHVTMVQRSPSYFYAPPATSELAETLRALKIPEEWTHEILRRQYMAQTHLLARMSAESPDELHAFLLESVRPLLPPGFDVDTHLTPRYRPWQQRIVIVPNGDLFAALREGKASMVTDTIETFTERGAEGRLRHGDPGRRGRQRDRLQPLGLRRRRVHRRRRAGRLHRARDLARHHDQRRAEHGLRLRLLPAQLDPARRSGQRPGGPPA